MPKSRGRRRTAKAKTSRRSLRPTHPADQLLGDARRFGGFDNALRAEIWASSELGQIWVKATGAVLVPATIAPKITRASYA